jgi:mannan endo-1,6-alpha-mannosidase
LLDSVKSAASIIAQSIIDQYPGSKSGQIPGLFPTPYYWWSAGAVWDTMVDYWFLTGDASYNTVVETALQFQVGENNDYQPVNQTKDEGNDDQSTWGLAALTAAERNFPAPSSNLSNWSLLAENVFNEQVSRWDTTSCNGGLRWQIFSFNNGYNYKNTLANANFFQLAARLGHYTGNTTYSDWANQTFDWLQNVGLLASDGSVYDGSDLTINCSQINHLEWTIGAGSLLSGSAYMYNMTGNTIWQQRITTLLSNIQSKFFTNSVMIEQACESHGNCDTDERFYKGILAMDMARTAVVAPFTAAAILPLLQSTAKAAVNTACSSSNGTCGFDWTETNDTPSDLASDFSVFSVVLGNLVSGAKSIQTQNGTLGQGSNSKITLASGSSPSKSDSTSNLVPTVIWRILLLLSIVSISI